MKVIKCEEDASVEFDNGLVVIGEGHVDCCANNYLDFEQLPIGTELPTLTADEFAKYIDTKEDGFSVKASDGTPKWVQARSEQNGYYSNMTTLVLKYEGKRLPLGEFAGDETDE